jgi:hypothetical protein
MARPWMTVFETASYLARAQKLLTQSEQENVVRMVAQDPTCGDLMEGTGGVRKVRIGVGGRGKSGGARVVYFFHGEAMPLYLLGLFAKNDKANLTKAERNALASLVVELKRAHRG